MTSQVDREHSVQLDIVDMYMQLVGGGRGGGGGCCTDDSALLKRFFIFELTLEREFLSLTPLSLLVPWYTRLSCYSYCKQQRGLPAAWELGGTANQQICL